MPERVVALTQEIERHLLLLQVIEKPLCARPVSAAVYVNHYFRSRDPQSSGCILYATHSRFEQPPELPPLGIIVVSASDSAIGPQKAPRDLIADLNILRHCAGELEGLDASAVVIVHLLF